MHFSCDPHESPVGSIQTVAMHVLIVNFNLQGLSEAEYRQACDSAFAPAFRDAPGLLTKTWLSDPGSNTYGGVYVWRDRAALDAYLQSELFRTVANHPNLTNISSRDFEVLEAPTRVTRGWIG